MNRSYAINTSLQSATIRKDTDKFKLLTSSYDKVYHMSEPQKL